jgi:hypothetical protein
VKIPFGKIPNHEKKSQMTKSQKSKAGGGSFFWNFGHWDLGFFWDLGFRDLGFFS